MPHVTFMVCMSARCRKPLVAGVSVVGSAVEATTKSALGVKSFSFFDFCNQPKKHRRHLRWVFIKHVNEQFFFPLKKNTRRPPASVMPPSSNYTDISAKHTEGLRYKHKHRHMALHSQTHTHTYTTLSSSHKCIQAHADGHASPRGLARKRSLCIGRCNFLSHFPHTDGNY